jgi:hypothetical protein
MSHYCWWNRRVANPIKYNGYEGRGRIAMLILKHQILPKACELLLYRLHQFSMIQAFPVTYELTRRCVKGSVLHVFPCEPPANAKCCIVSCKIHLCPVLQVLLRRTKLQCAADLVLPPRTVVLRKDPFDVQEADFYEALYTQSQAVFGGCAVN